MSKNARDRRPYVKPVQRVELSEINVKLRMILIVLLLSIAVVAVIYGLFSLLNTEPGWQEVEVSSSDTNCSADFVLMYEFGKDGVDATTEAKNVNRMYTYLTEVIYQTFSAETEAEFGNVYALNRHPNETVSVAHDLYKALELVVEYDSRYPFMAPVTAAYGAVFLSANDEEAALYDPMCNAEQMAYVQETAAYCADPEMIHVELLGDDQVRLVIAQEYLDYAEENEIETFLDFGWLTNAFIIDEIADTLAASGYTHGYIASYDGFTRNLDDRGNSYSFNIFHRTDGDVYMPARLDYSGPMSIVSLRDYPMTEEDQWHYHAYGDGKITTVFLDPADGKSKSSVDGLTAYSDNMGCAEILLKTAPVFIADSFDAYALETLEKEGIHSVRCYNKGVVFTQENAAVTLLEEEYSLVHSVSEE